MNKEMRRDFYNREDLIAYLKQEFPEAAKRDEHISETVGGYKAAKKALQKVDPKIYAKTRNFLNGKVT
ncbi:MAG: deoxyribodipyrimidine photo-lyase, partial [Cyanobacteria bacterium J06632_19]